MIVVSSLYEYGTRILTWPQRAKTRPIDIENGEEPQAAYELVDNAHDSRPSVISSSDMSNVPFHGDATDDRRTETRSSTPQTGEGQEDGREGSIKNKKRRSHKYKVLFGLALPFALQSLDTTIIASALPFIAADFGMFAWCCASTITRSKGHEFSSADCLFYAIQVKSNNSIG